MVIYSITNIPLLLWPQNIKKHSYNFKGVFHTVFPAFTTDCGNIQRKCRFKPTLTAELSES